MSKDQESAGTTRRDFLRGAAVTVAAGAVSSMPTTAEAMRRIIGANDRINVGHVGLGSQGYGAHVRLMKERADQNNTQQIAVCDLFNHRILTAQKHLGLSDGQTYTDFRRFLENKDIDAVVVATSDNWHAPIVIAAMKAGKHVYCEKPMCKTVEEAFAIYDTVKSTKRIFQVGSQGCTDQKWHVAQKVVADGRIGHVVVGQGSYMRNGRVGEWNNYGDFYADAGPQASGEMHVDWETFRKGTDPKEWDADRFFRWRKYWEYGSGLVGDLFPHRLHPLFIAMNLPTDGLHGFPMRVSSNGGLYVQKYHTSLKNPATGKMDRPDREVPDFTTITADFGDMTMMAMSSTINEVGWEDCIRGNKATLYFGGNGVKIQPERTWADEVEAATEPVPGAPENIPDHEKNWFDCIRTNGVPNANIDIAVRVQVMISMGEMAYRQGKTLHFHPESRTVSDRAPLDEMTKIAYANTTVTASK
jgi:predicted dehydrogenase